MTVWSRQQINRARGIRAKVDVDEIELARHHDDLLNSVHHKVAGAMKQIGQTFALEIDPRDVQISEGPAADKPPFTVEVQAWWEPQVKTVELLGGWKDGERMEYRDAPQPFRVMKPPPPVAMFDLTEDPTALVEIADTYVCTGWHEQDRHWIYEVQS